MKRKGEEGSETQNRTGKEEGRRKCHHQARIHEIEILGSMSLQNLLSMNRLSVMNIGKKFTRVPVATHFAKSVPRRGNLHYVPQSIQNYTLYNLYSRIQNLYPCYYANNKTVSRGAKSSTWNLQVESLPKKLEYSSRIHPGQAQIEKSGFFN